MPLFASQLQGVAPVRSLAAPSASSQAVPGLRPRTCSCPGRSRQPSPVVCGAATVESSLAASTSQPVHILAPCAAGRLIYGGTVSRCSTCAPPASRCCSEVLGNGVDSWRSLTGLSLSGVGGGAPHSRL